jgi:hypothetical protein
MRLSLIVLVVFIGLCSAQLNWEWLLREQEQRENIAQALKKQITVRSHFVVVRFGHAPI